MESVSNNTFLPRVRESLICVLSNIPLVMRVLKMASFTSSRVGTLLKARAFAESNILKSNTFNILTRMIRITAKVCILTLLLTDLDALQA